MSGGAVPRTLLIGVFAGAGNVYRWYAVRRPPRPEGHLKIFLSVFRYNQNSKIYCINSAAYRTREHHGSFFKQYQL